MRLIVWTEKHEFIREIIGNFDAGIFIWIENFKHFLVFSYGGEEKKTAIDFKDTEFIAGQNTAHVIFDGKDFRQIPLKDMYGNVDIRKENTSFRDFDRDRKILDYKKEQMIQKPSTP